MKVFSQLVLFIIMLLSFVEVEAKISNYTPSFLWADSTASSVEQVSTDSTNVLTDSLAKTKSDIDSIIYSTATDSLIFDLNLKKMYIYGSGHLRYKETNLTSGKIDVDFETSNVEAFGYGFDSTKNKELQTPVLNDKGEEYQGVRMRYNFKTTKGFITYASTETDNTAYSGAKIKKVNKDVFFVENGVYTTCEEEEPHYCFVGHEMKVIQKEQMIGKWIWLTFGGVPFPIPLPFAVFPLQSGRRSGIIPPAIGDREGYGRYFSRFGYFWAINDYMDANITADYYMKGGYSLANRFRYVKRYSFSGNLETGFSDLHSGEITDADRTEQKDWRIRWVHNQTLTPTSRFDMNLEFLSGNFIKQNSTDYNQLLRNDVISNASYYKTWEEFGSSLSMNYSRNQNLENGNITEYLPTMNFSKSQFYPFRSKKRTGNEAWYEQFGINYSGQFQNRRIKNQGDLNIRGGVNHNVGMGVSSKIGYININPNFSYREIWYNKQMEAARTISEFTGADTIVYNDVKRLGFVRTFGMGVSASTKLYGIVQPNRLGVAALRHVMTPGISYNYQPDFSKDKWGYFATIKDSSGNEIRYNKFAREIFGGGGSGESQSLGFRIDNLFEMKTMADPRDTTSKEQKLQLLNLSGNINYNFAADSLKFSDIQLGYRTQLSDFLSFAGNSTYSLYKYDVTKNTEVNQFIIKDKQGLARLKNFNFSISASISGDRLKSSDSKPKSEGEQIVEEESAYQQQTGTHYKGLYDDQEPDFTIPWSVSLNYNYGLSKYNPQKPTKYITLSGSLNFNLTPNWKFTTSGSYDVVNKQFSAPQVMISRDLHCWIMNFTWNPIGSYRGYRFEIKVKAPQLQDLKVTKTDRFFSGRR
ncbi:MAG: LPS-assembly protein LptD [Ignavibacteriaceae bacterium]|nr:LPS-assembly protein LptD [Ignavibacteriaceae bacterium]